MHEISNEAVLLPMVRKQFADEAFANVSMFPNVGSITERDLPTNAKYTRLPVQQVKTREKQFPFVKFDARYKASLVCG